MIITISGIIGLILIIILGRPSNKQARVDSATGHDIIYCGIRYKVLALIIGIQIPITVILALYPIFTSFNTISSFLGAMIAAFIFGGIKLCIMSLRYEIELTPDAIIEKRLMKGTVIIEWKKVKKALRINRAIEIYSVDGVKIRIPQTMDGYPTLLERVKEKRPKSTANLDKL